MNLLFLTLTVCLTFAISAGFLLPREVNPGNPVKVAEKSKRQDKYDDQQKNSSAMIKNPQEELKLLETIIEAFETHPKFVVVWMSLISDNSEMKTDPFGPFTPRAWLEMKKKGL